MYGALRFIAGVGLAGELGAAVTLVSETLHTSKRGYGTALVAGIGILGAIFAWYIADVTSWRTAYVLGGVLGLGLLALRVRVAESGMFTQLNRRKTEVRRGDLRLLFASRERIRRYLACIAIGVPIWTVIGVLVTFAPEFAAELGVRGTITAGSAIAFCYAGTSIGGVVAGGLSQLWMSRKRALFLFMVITAALVPIYLNCTGVSAGFLNFVFVLLGFGAGYWAVFMTISAGTVRNQSEGDGRDDGPQFRSRIGGAGYGAISTSEGSSDSEAKCRSRRGHRIYRRILGPRHPG